MPGKKPAPKPAKSKHAAAKTPARRADSRKTHARVAVAAKTAPVVESAKVTRVAKPAPKSAVAHRRAAAPGEASSGPVARAVPSKAALVPANAKAPLGAEADEELEAGSLLAGPRNVQPYVAKRGEQYMNREQLAHFQRILSSWKRDLMEEVDRTVSHMKDEAANFPDPNDRATQEEEFSLELRTRDRERKLIRKIDEALMRIDDGSYGYCLETGEEIGIKRLEARPVATLSIEAQERRERRERQYGERDDRYR